MASYDLDRVDWNKLSEEELKEIEVALKSELSEKEQREADMRAWGKIIFFMARRINWRYNQELIPVFQDWLSDKDMLKRHEIKDDRVYDWAGLKRDQRRYNREVQAEILRERWRVIKAKQAFFRELAQSRKNKAASQPVEGIEGLDDGFLSAIVEPFSPESQQKELIEQGFRKLIDVHEVHRVPWDQVLLSELRQKGNATLMGLPAYTAYGKLELVAKMQALLGLETRGHVEIVQDEPFQDPGVSAFVGSGQSSEVTVKHRQGKTEAIDLDLLGRAERLALIEKAKNGELICV